MTIYLDYIKPKMNYTRVVIIGIIVIIAIILIVLNQGGLGFNNKQVKSGDEIDTIYGPFICPYNSESEKNNAKKPLTLSDELKKLNNVNVQFADSPFSMEQVFGSNGAKSQLLTETEYSNTGIKQNRSWKPIDNAADYVPQHVLESPEDLRYGNPDIDGYSICDVNPLDSDDYYDPKLLNVKLKPSFKPLTLSISDEVELIGATDPPVCVAKDGLCNTLNTTPINSNPVADIIRGSDNPLPGPFSGRYKKCK